MIELIYIGDHFYRESRSLMSPIYRADGARYDWGFVQRDLAAGETVTIRQATDAERGHYERELRKLRDDPPWTLPQEGGR